MAAAKVGAAKPGKAKETKRKTSPFVRKLASIAKTIAKARAHKLHAPLYEAFTIFAAAADAPRAATIIDWMYGGRTPAPIAVVNAFSTSAIDGFCLHAGLGDRTRGLPRHERSCPITGSLEERVAATDAVIRARITADAYGGDAPTDDRWEKMAEGDPWRRNNRWRRIQRLVVDGEETAALRRLEALLADLPPDDRGAGYGEEIVLALDLALRNGAESRVAGWVARHGRRFESESFLIDSALCFRVVAENIAKGALREVIDLSEEQRGAALSAIDEALRGVQSTTAAAPKPAAAKTQKRRVSCEYSQIHLSPVALDETEKAQVHFQERGDSDRGISLFATNVGIGTPVETDYVDAEVSIATGAMPSLDGAVQAVAFPITVRGPIELRSATSGDDEDEPLVVPHGDYDVLARFVPKKAPEASAGAGLRVFTLLLTFHPAGALQAPRTLKIASG